MQFRTSTGVGVNGKLERGVAVQPTLILCWQQPAVMLRLALARLAKTATFPLNARGSPFATGRWAPMTTTFAPTQARAQRRARDSSDDIDTLVFERRPASRRSPSQVLTTPQPHDREMFESIMSQLAKPLRVIEQSKPISGFAITINRRPNVFEVPPQAGDPAPPWSTSSEEPTLTATGSYPRGRGRPRRRSILPIVAVLSWLAIGTGLTVDRGARNDVATRLRGATTLVVRATSLFVRGHSPAR